MPELEGPARHFRFQRWGEEDRTGEAEEYEIPEPVPGGGLMVAKGRRSWEGRKVDGEGEKRRRAIGLLVDDWIMKHIKMIDVV